MRTNVVASFQMVGMPHQPHHLEENLVKLEGFQDVREIRNRIERIKQGERDLYF